MTNKFYNVYVTYGKNHSYMFSDNVPENLLSDYMENAEKEIRKVGYKKQITFEFFRPFVAYGINESKNTSFSAYEGNGFYASVYCSNTRDYKEERKEAIVVNAIG